MVLHYRSALRLVLLRLLDDRVRSILSSLTSKRPTLCPQLFTRLQRVSLWDWREGSAAKSSGYTCSGCRFSSQNQQWQLRTIWNPVSGVSAPVSELLGHKTHTQCTYIHGGKLMHIKYIFKKYNRLFPNVVLTKQSCSKHPQDTCTATMLFLQKVP